MRGQRHLVYCRCVLPQFKSLPDPPKHQFVVFSVIDDDDNAVPKYAQCNNCGLVHKVVDICKSEILSKKESIASIISIDDIKTSLPPNLVDILERHNVEIATWEQAQHILENKEWGSFVTLTGEEEDGMRHGKYVRMMSESFFKIETFSRDSVVVLDEVKKDE
ncbi:MAG: hypothetical protein EBR82_00535 [Caulobacteraceae bacterium]|nr:hypothetical protein [Caulobacteraceae bacterium]